MVRIRSAEGSLSLAPLRSCGSNNIHSWGQLSAAPRIFERAVALDGPYMHPVRSVPHPRQRQAKRLCAPNRGDHPFNDCTRIGTMFDDRDDQPGHGTQVQRVQRPFLSSTGRGAVFLFGKAKRKIGGRESRRCRGQIQAAVALRSRALGGPSRSRPGKGIRGKVDRMKQGGHTSRQGETDCHASDFGHWLAMTGKVSSCCMI